MSDNAIRVYLDLPESAIMEMAMLQECRRAGAVLDIVATPVINKNTQNDRVEA